MGAKNGDKKHGRNKKAALRYKNEQRQEKSHIKRIKKHLVRFVGDMAAAAALKTYQDRLLGIRSLAR